MSAHSASSGISFATAARYWLRLGCLSFGGPAGQIALLHRELVDERRWISESSFVHALNYCMLLPGPEAQQLVTYVGWLLHGPRGGITAGALFILPSLLLMVVLAYLYLRFGDIPWVSGVFAGIKPAVTALVAEAALRLGRRTLKSPVLRLVAIAAFLALTWWKLPFPGVIVAAACIGALLGHFAPAALKLSDALTASTPAATRPQASSRAALGAFSLRAGSILCTWGLPMLLLVVLWGWHGMPAQVGLFFSKAALVSFGGAYAVLPYVNQGAIVEHAWVTPQQMIDGMALGESTPGPLIMVVAFIAFIAGYQQGPWAGTDPFLSGALVALVATWFTFLPSFIFILGGAGLVERSRGNWRLAGPLAVIGAAVVGGVLNLGWFFANTTLFVQGRLAVWPCVIALFAFCALQFLRWSVPRVLLACGAAGGLSTLIPLFQKALA